MIEADHTHDTRCIVCSHVAEEGLPVLEVIHEHDGDWQFLCGGTDHVSVETARVACFGCVMKTDLSLAVLDDMPSGTWASREMGDGRWHRYRLD